MGPLTGFKIFEIAGIGPAPLFAMLRAGIGPVAWRARNPRLVYGRMAGWGQTGPLAQAAGHDLNYIALTGVLHAIGRAGAKPTPPLNLVGDFGGGALYLALGIACGLLETQRSGKGQVVDAAMTDGAASLMTMFFGMRAAGQMTCERGANILDSGAFFYEVYECADGRHVAVAPIEDKFLAELYRLLELDVRDFPAKLDAASWPAAKEKFAALFKTRTRDEWCRLLAGSDACFAPVLSIDEAPDHPHNKARGTFITVDGIVQPAPAPRFSRTPSAMPSPPHAPTAKALRESRFGEDEIATLKDAGAIA